jgi:hypothetical protein
MKDIKVTKKEIQVLQDIIAYWILRINDENWVLYDGNRYHHYVDKILDKLKK